MGSRNYSLSLFFLICTCCGYSFSNASSETFYSSITKDSSRFIIGDITIIGNKKTKGKIILREVDFQKGDTIFVENTPIRIAKIRNRIFNTNLFVTVDLTLIDRPGNVKDLLIAVQERWYIYPIAIFELADRNFNEWWSERNRDWKRINLGIFYTQRNMRGRNETLRAKFQLGFTKKFEVFYTIPYISKSQKAGVNFDISYILNKQFFYKTSHHKLVYFDGDRFIRDRFRTGIVYTYRNKFYQTHNVGVSFNHTSIADTITKLNPDYLLNGRSSQTYFSARYAFIKDTRDIAYYPLKGSYFKGEIEKLGLGIFKDLNQLNLIAEYAVFKNLHKKIFVAGGIRQKISFPYKQPYLNVRALGYERDYVSGYELYVIDGQHFSLLKLNLKYQLFTTKKDVEAVPVEEFGTIPFAIYLRMYSDAGYVWDNSYNPENVKLSNEYLWGGGLGIDFVSYYDLVFRMEYSFNRLGEHGFFLHFKSAI